MDPETDRSARVHCFPRGNVKNREEPTKVKTLKIAAVILALSLGAFAQQAIDLETVGTYPGTAISTGNGTAGAGVQRVTIASDNTAFQIKALGNAGAIIDFAGQNASSPANAWLIGGQFNTSPTTITSGNASPLQLDSSGKLLVDCATGCSGSSGVSLVPQTTGGLTLLHIVSAASTNATSTKASAGQVYHVCLNNNTSYPVFLKLYNKATAPTVGTDTPVHVLKADSGISSCEATEEGYAFGTGIALALTKGIADTDNTAVALNDATVEVAYK